MTQPSNSLQRMGYPLSQALLSLALSLKLCEQVSTRHGDRRIRKVIQVAFTLNTQRYLLPGRRVKVSLSSLISVEGKDLIRATLALVRYLADMRFKLSRWLNAEEPAGIETATSDVRILFSPSIEANDSSVQAVPDLELEEAAELVDTTLFRAYMLCRPQLVGPLVRRPNRCIPGVVQEMLEHAHVCTSMYGS